MKYKFLFVFLAFLLPKMALADCVYLSNVTGYEVSNYHNIILYNGNTPIALMKIFSFIYQGSSLRLLKTGLICSYTSNVFLADENDTVDVNEVEKL